jgi:manganese-transporting P-type ATPase
MIKSFESGFYHVWYLMILLVFTPQVGSIIQFCLLCFFYLEYRLQDYRLTALI